MNSRQQTLSKSLTHLIALNSVSTQNFPNAQENFIIKDINNPPSLKLSKSSKPNMPATTTNKYQVNFNITNQQSAFNKISTTQKVTGSKDGANFHDLASGNVKNFSCTNTIVLDHDLLQLADDETNILDIFRNILAAHTTRLLEAVEERSGREVEQFCVGHVHIQAKPEYVKLDLRNPNSWGKEKLSSTWR